MPSYVIKPEQDRDLYVYWSTVVDAPLFWAGRERMLAFLAEPGDDPSPTTRVERADEHGSSALWPRRDNPAFGWGQDFAYRNEGMLTRAGLVELCARLERDKALVEPDVSDLITAFEEAEPG